jgi:hypothetical protein
MINSLKKIVGLTSTEVRKACSYLLDGTVENIRRGWDVVAAPVIVMLVVLGCVFTMAFVVSLVANLGAFKGTIAIAFVLFIVTLIVGWFEGR